MLCLLISICACKDSSKNKAGDAITLSNSVLENVDPLDLAVNWTSEENKNFDSACLTTKGSKSNKEFDLRKYCSCIKKAMDTNDYKSNELKKATKELRTETFECLKYASQK